MDKFLSHIRQKLVLLGIGVTPEIDSLTAKGPEWLRAFRGENGHQLLKDKRPFRDRPARIAPRMPQFSGLTFGLCNLDRFA